MANSVVGTHVKHGGVDSQSSIEGSSPLHGRMYLANNNDYDIYIGDPNSKLIKIGARPSSTSVWGYSGSSPSTGFHDNIQATADNQVLRRVGGVLGFGTITTSSISDISSYTPTSRTITINGISQDLSANRTWTQDQITGLSSTGLIKRTGANTLAIATAGTDYLRPSDISGKYVALNDADAGYSGQISAVNLNNYTKTQVIYSNGNVTNNPNANSYVVWIGSVANTYGAQMAINPSWPDKFFFRNNYNTSWSSWYQVASREWVTSQNYITSASVSNATITLKNGGTTINSFTLNQASNKDIDLSSLMDNYVTLNTSQTITGQKTFDNYTFITKSATGLPGLTIKGQIPNLLFETDVTTGVVAFDIMKAVIRNSGGSATFGAVGVYGSATSLDSSYMYFDARPNGAYDNTTLKVDANNRIGIGLSSTNRPTETLDVDGKARIRTISSAGSPTNVLVEGSGGVIEKYAISSLNTSSTLSENQIGFGNSSDELDGDDSFIRYAPLADVNLSQTIKATTFDKLRNLPVNKVDPTLEKIARRLYGMPGIAINMWNQIKRDGLNSDIKNLAMLNMWTPLTEEALSYFKRMSGHPILEELLQATKEAYCHQGTSKETEILVAPCFRQPTTSAVQREMSARAVQDALSFSHELTSYPDLVRSVFEVSQYDMITLAGPAEVPADPLTQTQTP